MLRDSQDGFVIAEKDLQIREPGEVLGTKQTGIAEFKIASLIRDRKMIPLVQHNARQIIEHFSCVDGLIKRWLDQKRTMYSNA